MIVPKRYHLGWGGEVGGYGRMFHVSDSRDVVYKILCYEIRRLSVCVCVYVCVFLSLSLSLSLDWRNID